MSGNERFARLVGVACHDLSNPLATIYGFARTLARTDLDPRAARYVATLEAASSQLSELLNELRWVARIEAGTLDPRYVELDSLELAREAAAELGEGRVRVDGKGATVRVPENDMRRGLSQLARAASRHGGFDSVALDVAGPELALSPVTPTSGQVLLGDEPRDFSAAAATLLVRAVGGDVTVDGERLRIRLPAA